MSRSILISLLMRGARHRAERDAATINAIADFDFGPAPIATSGDVASHASAAELRARRAVDLMVPAIAVACKAKADLVAIAADFGTAAEAQAAFRDAAEDARALAEVLESASTRLLIVLTAVARDDLCGTAR
jgi:hypothetical protein